MRKIEATFTGRSVQEFKTTIFVEVEAAAIQIFKSKNSCERVLLPSMGNYNDNLKAKIVDAGKMSKERRLPLQIRTNIVQKYLSGNSL